MSAMCLKQLGGLFGILAQASLPGWPAESRYLIHWHSGKSQYDSAHRCLCLGTSLAIDRPSSNGWTASGNNRTRLQSRSLNLCVAELTQLALDANGATFR